MSNFQVLARLIAFATVFSATTASARETSTGITLTMGSTIATWRLPAAGFTTNYYDQIASGLLLDSATSADLMEAMVCKDSNIGQEALPGGANLFVNRMVQKEVPKVTPNWTMIPRVPAIIVRGACDFIPIQSAQRYQAVTAGTVVDVPAVGHALLENPVAVEQSLAAFVRDQLAQIP